MKRALCGLLGHQPTEQASFQRDTVRCACGAVEVTGRLRAEWGSGWWMGLVRWVLR